MSWASAMPYSAEASDVALAAALAAEEVGNTVVVAQQKATVYVKVATMAIDKTDYVAIAVENVIAKEANVGGFPELVLMPCDVVL
jgi:hypothetical protein